MSEVKVLTRDEILSAKMALAREYVEIPEWGGGVFVRQLSALEMDNFGKSISKMDANHRSRFAVLVACDGEGKPLFEKKDAGELGTKSSRAVQRIFDAGWKLNGMNEQDIEELEKNSETTTDDD